MSLTKGKVSKDARDLAARVNALEGYSARLVDSGSHRGLAFKVEGPDGHVCRFSSHASVGALAMVRAEAELRRLGVPLPRKKEGKKVAAVKDEQRERTLSLRDRISSYLERNGGDSADARRTLAQRAVDILEFRISNGNTEVEQFGSTGAGKSPPRDIARESLRGLLDKNIAATEKSWERWSAVLDAIEESQGQNGAVPVAAAPAPVAHAEVNEALREALERAELAEGVVSEVEAEREAAKARCETAESEAERLHNELAAAARRVSGLEARVENQAALEERVVKAEAAAKAAQAELDMPREVGSSEAEDRLRADLVETKQLYKTAKSQVAQAKSVTSRNAKKHEEAMAALEAAVEQERFARQDAERRLQEGDAVASQRLRDAIGHKEAAQLTAAVACQERDAARALAEEQSHTIEDLQAMVAGWEAEGSAREIRQMVIDALLTELHHSQGSPRPWLLERIDVLLNIDGTAF